MSSTHAPKIGVFNGITQVTHPRFNATTGDSVSWYISSMGGLPSIVIKVVARLTTGARVLLQAESPRASEFLRPIAVADPGTSSDAAQPGGTPATNQPYVIALSLIGGLVVVGGVIFGVVVVRRRSSRKDDKPGSTII